jgi:hypothetical protein
MKTEPKPKEGGGRKKGGRRRGHEREVLPKNFITRGLRDVFREELEKVR